LSGNERILLRAELHWDDRVLVTRTEQLTTSLLKLPIAEPPAEGTRVWVRLSFPRLVAPFDVRGTIVKKIMPTNPTELPLIEVKLDEDDVARRRIAGLIGDDTAVNASDLAYRILIVEDNSMIRDMFAYGVHKYFGKRGGVTVDVADDGEKAWQMLREGGYDLAIVDHYLPLLRGSQLIARIREDDRMATMPIVAISVGGDEVREAALHAGADLFLDKPVVLRDLFTTLDRLTTLPGDAG
jgi:CheY-like chemotaxis protein